MSVDSLTSLIRQYDDREVDVSLFGNVPVLPVEETLLQLAIISSGDSGHLVTGKQKLAQKVWLELTTELGSMTFAPERGSGFFSSLRANRPRTPVELLARFALAAEDIKAILRADELETDPDDERLLAITATNAVIDRNRVELTLEILAADNQTIEIIAPIPLTV
jgi:hypothetical protein